MTTKEPELQNPLCLNSNTYHGFSFEDAIAGAKAAGLHYIEVSAVRDWTEHVMPEFSDEELERVKALMAEADITPIGMCGHSNLMTEEGRANFIKNLDLAQKLGIKVVATGTGETHGDHERIDDEAELIEIIRNLSAEAAKRGISICVETHGANYATGVQIKELVEKVGVDNFGINYDTANVILYANTPPYEDLEASVDKVIWIHLKDKAGAWNEWNFPAIGDGDTDFRRVFDILEKAGNTVPLSIEVEFTEAGPANVQEVHDAVKRSVEAIKALA